MTAPPDALAVAVKRLPVVLTRLNELTSPPRLGNDWRSGEQFILNQPDTIKIAQEVVETGTLTLAALAAAEARVRTLTEALEPFADVDVPEHAVHMCRNGDDYVLVPGDFRRASAALKDTDAPAA